MSSCEIPESGCPVELAIAIFGSKWKLLILRVIILNGGARYNELLRLVAGISAKELTRNLRELESAGLVDHSDPAGVYCLSSDGTSLVPIFEAMRDWGLARMGVPQSA